MHVVRARLPHRCTYPLRANTLFNIVAVFRTSTYAERGDIASYRAELDRTYRDSHPTMKASAGDDGSGAALGDLRPRSDPALEPGPRHAAVGDAAHPTLQSLAQGACMAIEDAVCARRMHRARRRRLCRRVPRLRARPLSAHRAGAVRVPLSLGQFLSRRRHRARSRARRSASARTEHEMFDCLAWLYDGFPLPAKAGAAA